MIFNLLSKKGQSYVNCQEAYSTWDLLTAKYQFLEKLHIWQNFAHDIDLKYLLENIDRTLTSIVNMLEKECEKHSLPGPEVGVINVNTSVNTEVIRDEIIAADVFLWLQGVVELLLRAIRTTTTNDNLRETFIKINTMNLGLMNDIVAYLRLKGWINVPLRYPNIPKDIKEEIDAGEAFHLWDHLTFRYDSIHQTEIYKDLVNDSDMKTLITIGLQEILKKQADRLEKECLHFGIPLPKKPAKVISWPQEASYFIKDDYIYRLIYTGIVGATLIHVSAVKQSLTNDRIRKFFIDLLLTEINIQNRFIRYGKLKGYINEAPHYTREKV